MSDGGRRHESLGVKVWMSSRKWSVERSAVRSIAWLGLWWPLEAFGDQFKLRVPRDPIQLHDNARPEPIEAAALGSEIMHFVHDAL